MQKKYTPLHNETLQEEKKKGLTKCTQICAQNINPYLLRVVPLGIEPRLFCTKNRRVASYTMGQFRLRIYFLFSILPNFLLNYSLSFKH